MIELLSATPEVVTMISRSVRRADALELEALGFRSPREGIEESLRYSVRAWVGWCGSAPLGVFGYAVPVIIGQGCMPWMITTTHVERHRVAFARASRRITMLLMAEFNSAENWVDARHAVCIRWLRWLGFTIYPAQALPPREMLFHRFSMKGI
jgi:hypothetical protein